MSDTISIKKLKRIMYRVLRWRLQLGDYVSHQEIPLDSEVTEFSRGVKVAYRDLLQEIEKIEKSENQRRVWGKDKRKWYLFGDKDDDEEDFVNEMRWDSERE